MVYKCAVIDCRSGYRENQDQKVTFHSFPLEDKHLLQTWLKRLARKDYVPTKHSKFVLFISSSKISSLTQLIKRIAKKKKRNSNFNKKATKKRCMPFDFQSLPSYYTHNNYLVRSELSTSSSRFENEAARPEEQNEVFLNADKVKSFKDLIEKLPKEVHRQRYILHRTENGADLICLSDHRPYTILSAVFINMDMEVTVYNCHKLCLGIPKDQLS